MKTTFNPQAFLAGLSPGNYGTTIAPPIDYTSPRFRDQTSTYVPLDANRAKRELLISRAQPVCPEEIHSLPRGNLFANRLSQCCCVPENQQ